MTVTENNGDHLSLKDIDVCYGNYQAVSNVSFSLKKGDIACLLGPSGCGKTSLQRAIAGFEAPRSGHIQLAGKTVSNSHYVLPPEKRRVGMVFQDFALFPHLNVEKNIAFGCQHLSRQARRDRVTELLALTNLSGYEKQYPHELSGGQQQRIALARAIAPRPDILLLDEAFSSLDADLREFIAKEVRRLLKADNITAILVTHDQHEAFAIADKVGVMHDGKLLQWGTAYDIYHRPNSRFVAKFVGEGSLIHVPFNEQGQLANALGIVAADENLNKHTSYSVLLRPDDIIFSPDSDIRLPVCDRLFRGAEYLYQLALPDGQKVLCVAPSHVHHEVGELLPIETDLKHVVIFEDEEA